MQVTMFYEDSSGSPRSWTWGWYVDPPGTGTNTSPNETAVDPATWVHVNFDILDQLSDARSITRLRVGGSGWNFVSAADNVSLAGDETSLITNGDFKSDFIFDGSNTIPTGWNLFATSSGSSETSRVSHLDDNGPGATGDLCTSFLQRQRGRLE